MKTKSEYPKKIYIGNNNGKEIYLSAPSWDCGWYWGFGYLGNSDCHYHVSGLRDNKNINLYNAFLNHFGKSLIIRKSKLWSLCELFETFYTLKKAAEVLGRGGSHYTNNPCKDIIMNKEEVDRINKVVLPEIFGEIYKILIPSQDNINVNSKFLDIITNGDMVKTLMFMSENNIHPDDLLDIEGVSEEIYTAIHTAYWKKYHGTKGQI